MQVTLLLVLLQLLQGCCLLPLPQQPLPLVLPLPVPRCCLSQVLPQLPQVVQALLLPPLVLTLPGQGPLRQLLPVPGRCCWCLEPAGAEDKGVHTQ